MQDDPKNSDDQLPADRTSHAMKALRAGVEAHSILIYQPADLQRAIEELEGGGEWDDTEYLGPENEKLHVPPDPASLTSEDSNRRKCLQRIANDRLGPRRRLVLGSARMKERVEAIKLEAPHFAVFVDLVSRAIHLSMATNTPLHLPPVLLVGEPGIGKTFVLKRTAEATGVDFELFPMNIIDSFRLRGLNTAWKGARMGRVAETLLKSTTASPIILLDEFEKMPQMNAFDRPYDPFHSLLEEENAQAFIDDFLEIPIRADQIFWIASANSTINLPEPIVDRLLIVEIPAPTREQLELIVTGIYTVIRDRYADHFALHLAENVGLLLARHNPRRLRRIIELAIGLAAAETRKALSVSDVERAVLLASVEPQGFRHPVGFMSRKT